MPYDRGDVVLAYFPNSDLIQVKQRPALVVQASGLNTQLQQVMLAAITSNLVRAGLPSRVLLGRSDPRFAATHLVQESVIMADNIATVQLSKVVKKLGVLSSMADVDQALRVAVGL